MKEKLLEIINHYGLYNTLKYIHSEYFELDESIINFENGIDNIDKVKEELSDCLCMLKQIQYYYDIKDSEVEKVIEYKLDRQIKRIKGSDKE